MVFNRIKAYPFIFLALLGFEQSCRTAPVVPPMAERATEVETREPTANKPAASDSEPAQPKPQAAEQPKLSAEFQPTQRLPESVISAPDKELASAKINYDTQLTERAVDLSISAGWRYRKDRQNQIVGFEFSNRGGNPILLHRHDIEKNLFFTRDFQFRFDDRARQDIHLFISDWVASRDRQFRLSELMNSVLHFFPRNYLPAILSSGGRHIVTLSTGEQVEFDGKTHEIVSGVFSEAPVDLNTDRAARKFPGVTYIGKGVLVRADARGSDPRIGNTAVITTGSPPLNCQKEAGCNECRVPSQELWQQEGAVRFRFSNDAEFHRYLLSRCSFGIPETNTLIVVSPVP
jgi:hypothetical protein